MVSLPFSECKQARKQARSMLCQRAWSLASINPSTTGMMRKMQADLMFSLYIPNIPWGMFRPSNSSVKHLGVPRSPPHCIPRILLSLLGDIKYKWRLLSAEWTIGSVYHFCGNGYNQDSKAWLGFWKYKMSEDS